MSSIRTQRRLLIVSSVAIVINTFAAASSLVSYWFYVASHPGSRQYFRLIVPLMYLSLAVFVILSTIRTRRSMKETQRIIEETQKLREEAIARRTNEVGAARTAFENARRFIDIEQRPDVFNPAGVRFRLIDVDELIDSRTPEQRQNAEAKARVNLERVVKALNCKSTLRHYPEVGLMYEFDAKDGTHFAVDAVYIYRIGPEHFDMTCYTLNVSCPQAEKIATALLQLNRNPKIFEFLKNNHGEWVL